MRVLLLDQFAEIGGAQCGFLEAAEGFASRGWELHAVIPAGPLADRIRPLCASVTTIPCGPFRSVTKSFEDGVRFVRQLREQTAAIRRQSVDVLYVNGPRVLAAAAWGRQGQPVVFHSHSVVTQRMAANVAWQALRRSEAHVLASSEFVTQWLRPHVPADRIRVVYNGIRSLGATPRVRERYTRVGVLGRIAPEKGQLTFVRAARMAAEANPALTFRITGAPVFGDPDYASLVRKEAGSHVIFADWTDNIGSFFADVDVLVVPSEAVDANPRVIPEAYAAGVPVIAFDSGGVGELLTHDETGILVRERSARALAGAVCEAVRHPEQLNRIARNGHQRWKDRYTLLRFQSEVCDALERVVEARSPLPSARASASA